MKDTLSEKLKDNSKINSYTLEATDWDEIILRLLKNISTTNEMHSLEEYLRNFMGVSFL